MHSGFRRTARTTLVQMDWWYDARGFDPYTVEELAEQCRFALIELTSEAIAGAAHPDGRRP